MSQALCTAYRLPVCRVRNIQAMWLTHYVVTCKPWFYSENADFIYIYISIYYRDIYTYVSAPTKFRFLEVFFSCNSLIS